MFYKNPIVLLLFIELSLFDGVISCQSSFFSAGIYSSFFLDVFDLLGDFFGVCRGFCSEIYCCHGFCLEILWCVWVLLGNPEKNVCIIVTIELQSLYFILYILKTSFHFIFHRENFLYSLLYRPIFLLSHLFLPSFSYKLMLSIFSLPSRVEFFQFEG